MSNVPYLWLAYTDATSNLTNGCCTSNGIEWFMNHSEIPNAGSNFDPSIIASQPNPAPCLFYSQSHNIVILAIPDSSHQNQIVMYANVGDTNGISSTIDIPSGQTEPIWDYSNQYTGFDSKFAPALAEFNGFLYMAFVEDDSSNYIRIARMTYNSQVPTVINVPLGGCEFLGIMSIYQQETIFSPGAEVLQSSLGTPSLAVYNDRLHIAFTNLANTVISLSSADGQNWSTEQPLFSLTHFTTGSKWMSGFEITENIGEVDPGSGDLTSSNYSPCLVAWEGNLYLYLNAIINGQEGTVFYYKYTPIANANDAANHWYPWGSSAVGVWGAPALAVIDRTDSNGNSTTLVLSYMDSEHRIMAQFSGAEAQLVSHNMTSVAKSNATPSIAGTPWEITTKP
jgi:hypothetical protein